MRLGGGTTTWWEKGSALSLITGGRQVNLWTKMHMYLAYAYVLGTVYMSV